MKVFKELSDSTCVFCCPSLVRAQYLKAYIRAWIVKKASLCGHKCLCVVLQRIENRNFLSINRLIGSVSDPGISEASASERRVVSISVGSGAEAGVGHHL